MNLPLGYALPASVRGADVGAAIAFRRKRLPVFGAEGYVSGLWAGCGVGPSKQDGSGPRSWCF